MTRTPPSRWWCTKCGRQVTSPVTPSLDPRYATGRCLHGKPATEQNPEVVHVVASEAEADRLIDAREQARAYKRALRKELLKEPLSANEAAALAARRAVSA